MHFENKSSKVKSIEEQQAELSTLSAKQLTGDRRRPGRIESPNPALISMLRYPTVVIDTGTDYHDLRPLEGIVVGILLSIPFWTLIVVGVVWAVR